MPGSDWLDSVFTNELCRDLTKVLVLVLVEMLAVAGTSSIELPILDLFGLFGQCLNVSVEGLDPLFTPPIASLLGGV